MKKLFFSVILLFSAVMIASCSKKENNPAVPENTESQTNNQTTPSVPKLFFKGPNTSVVNEITNQIKNFISGFNNYSLPLSSAFASVQPKNSGNEWKWVLSHDNGATETFTAISNADGSFTWTVTYNGTINAVSYTNWKAMEGTTSKDGKSGEWKIYKDNTAIVAAKISWSNNSSAVTGTLTVYENSVLQSKTEIVNNSNQAGALKYYGEGPTILWEADWNADGTGTWKTYSSGLVRNSGKF